MKGRVEDRAEVREEGLARGYIRIDGRAEVDKKVEGRVGIWKGRRIG